MVVTEDPYDVQNITPSSRTFDVGFLLHFLMTIIYVCVGLKLMCLEWEAKTKGKQTNRHRKLKRYDVDHRGVRH